MKIKQRPEDFVVREESRIDIVPDGPFAVYRLRKRGIGSLEAAAALARLWKISRTRIALGGLKDRHAVAEQAVTVRGGPARGFSTDAFSLEYLGRSAGPAGRATVGANAFTIVVRDLTREEAEAMRSGLAAAARDGFPNYFDSQRFGSLRGSDEFIARHLLRGDAESALKAAVAAPAPEDPSGHRKIKAMVRDLWGRWPEAKAALPRSSERSLVTFLCDHPSDFRRAFELIEENRRLLYLSACQSWLWNRTLAAWLRSRLPAAALAAVAHVKGEIVFWRSLPAEVRPDLEALKIPLPSRNIGLVPEDVREILEGVLKEEGLSWPDFRLKGFKSTYFKKGLRPALVRPRDASAGEPEKDDLSRGRWKLRLAFALPSGCYATMLVKAMGLGKPTEANGS